ncbi:MAG: hypothetical protein JXR23_09000 [Pontiellaceae bacterium]|nr:hypothetical protein [Pontiellaceae bacterium]
MRRVVSIVLLLAAFVASAGAQQSGVPARMTIVGGNTADVFLQKVEDGNVIFQANRSSANRSGPVDKIFYLQFLSKLDGEMLINLFSTADYAGMIQSIDQGLNSKTDQYWQFMSINNNYKKVFLMLMESYFEVGNYEQAAAAGEGFAQNEEDDLAADKGRAMLIRIALMQDQIKEAEKRLEEVVTPPAKLYLTACIQQKKGEYKASIWSVADLLVQYANDLDWVPQAELLNAVSYRLWADDEVEPYMDSAISTARQVEHIHVDSSCAGEAKQLQEQWILEKAQMLAEEQARAATLEKELARVEGDAEEATEEATEEAAEEASEESDSQE